MSEPPDNSDAQQSSGEPSHTPGRKKSEPSGERTSALVSGCLSTGGFVVLTVFLSIALAQQNQLVYPIVLAVIAACGVPLLFVRNWPVRGIGIGLLLGWGTLTIVSGGVCTGLDFVT